MRRTAESDTETDPETSDTKVFFEAKVDSWDGWKGKMSVHRRKIVRVASSPFPSSFSAVVSSLRSSPTGRPRT